MFKLITSVSLSCLLITAQAIVPESQFRVGHSVLSLYTNHNLNSINSTIDEAIIVVHGSVKNADTYFTTFDNLSKKYNRADRVIVVSPHFKTAPDVLLENELSYTDEGWLSGDESLTSERISSFDVLESMISTFADKAKFPNLKKITLTGHSAGGQITQRFAFATNIENKFKDIKFRYVVLNPGSYVYLNKLRPVLNSNEFKVPDVKNCRDYNEYKFGLEKPNEFVSRIDLSKLVNQFINKDVTYLIGEKDIIEDDIDQSCPAALQGPSRLARGRNMKRFLDIYYPSHKHQLVTVPGIGHTQGGMYNSENGVKAVLGDWF